MARSSDEDFDVRIDELARIAHRVAFRLLGSGEDARDIAQESLARAYQRWGRVHRYAEPWVARVATNLALDQLRAHKRHGGPQPSVVFESDGVAALRADVQELLLRLPRRQREVVALRFLADLPDSRVAELLGCSVGTVKQHTHRGLTTLRTMVGPDRQAAMTAGWDIS